MVAYFKSLNYTILFERYNDMIYLMIMLCLIVKPDMYPANWHYVNNDVECLSMQKMKIYKVCENVLSNSAMQ